MKIPFNANNPFPIAPAGSTYADAQAHSAKVDQWAGFAISTIEADLKKKEPITDPQATQAWIGLKDQALLTPYTEIRAILDDLSPSPLQQLIDLGAGYGRIGLVMAAHFSEARFLGYELIAERVNEGNRVLRLHGAKNSTLIHQDLTAQDFVIPRADFYFIYDYGTRDSIERTLQDLKSIATQNKITVVGRGRATRDAIERHHPWLSGVNTPIHRGNYSIYRS